VTPQLPEPFHLIDLDAVGSTNNEVFKLAAQDAKDWTVVRAREQLAGRGRQGKSFASPPGNSYTSFLMRPFCAPAQAAQIALVTGLAVAEAMGNLAPELPRAFCKWPNDVLIDDHKVAGILVESSIMKTSVETIVVGIGVNLTSHPDLPGLRISDLQCLGASNVDRDIWLQALCVALHRRIQQWESEGFAALHNDWSARAAGIGRRVTVQMSPPVTGRLRGIDTHGHLLVDDQAGVTHRCVSGSLVLEDVA
tara:strand:- start:20 stop:772 length:753 start_codon:yes stop_codon:yes gene_type:complete